MVLTPQAFSFRSRMEDALPVKAQKATWRSQVEARTPRRVLFPVPAQPRHSKSDSSL